MFWGHVGSLRLRHARPKSTGLLTHSWSREVNGWHNPSNSASGCNVSSRRLPSEGRGRECESHHPDQNMGENIPFNDENENDSVVRLVDTSSGRVQGGFCFGGTGNRDATSGFSFVMGDKPYRLFSVVVYLQPTDEQAKKDEYPAFQLKVFKRSDKQNAVALSNNYMHPDWRDAQLISRTFTPVEFFFPEEFVLEVKTEYIMFPDPIEGTGWYRFAGTQGASVTAEGCVATAGMWWRYLNTVENPPYAVFKSNFLYHHLYVVKGIA